MSNNQGYISINDTATTVEKSLSFVVYNIKLIKNDAGIGGNDLLISLNGAISDNNYLVLKPGEFYKDFSDTLVNSISYKSSGNIVPFRFVALTSRG